jgi:hypothetical protein
VVDDDGSVEAAVEGVEDLVTPTPDLGDDALICVQVSP